MVQSLIKASEFTKRYSARLKGDDTKQAHVSLAKLCVYDMAQAIAR